MSHMLNGHLDCSKYVLYQRGFVELIESCRDGKVNSA